MGMQRNRTDKNRQKISAPSRCAENFNWGNYRWILPEPSPPASFSTSATVTML